MWRAVAAMFALALALAPLGALAGFAAHWNIIQPSDADLEDAARTLVGTPIGHDGDLVASGGFAPTFTRGYVHWDVESDVALDAPAVVSAAERAGWHVDAAGADSLRASRGGIRLDADLVAGAQLSVVVERGPAGPSMTMTVTVGAVLGVLLAVLVVRGIRRPPRLRARRRAWLPLRASRPAETRWVP